MISFEEAIAIHKILIQKFGGSTGLRDRNALSAALARPEQQFDNIALYPTPQEKAAALVQSIISNHPFIDGNKRVGFVLMKLILLENNKKLVASESELYNFIVGIATGEIDINGIKTWIYEHTQDIQP